MTPEQLQKIQEFSALAIFDYMVDTWYDSEKIDVQKIFDYVMDPNNYTPIYYDENGEPHKDLRITKDDYEKFLLV